MDEALWGAGILLLVVGVITLVGHGIWITLAALFKPSKSRSHDEFCTRCGSKLGIYGCPNCTSAPAPPTELGDLDAADRVFGRLHSQGILDKAKFDWLMAVTVSERNRLGVAHSHPHTRPAAASPEAISHPAKIEETSAPAPQAAELPRPVAAREVLDEPVPRSLAESLAGYMETRNIRWGEIIGGLLILGCSLALTISFWSQIEQIPILKFGIFTAMTAAFAGLGLYSEHRWKLPYTSRGLLATAVLLVPLNFLAIAALSNDQSGNKILAWGGVLSAFFGLLIFRAGRVLAPALAAPLTAGLLIPSFTELLIRKFEVPGELAYGTIIISAVLVVSYHLVTIWVLRSEGILLKERLLVFGSISFASILSFCFLLLRTEIFSESLHRLGPIVCLFATPAVLLGAWMWNQVKAEAFENVAGTALSVLGFGVLAIGFLFSWQACGNLLLASLICAGVSFLAAHFTGKWGFRLAGLFLLSLAWTVGANLAFGRIKPDSGETVLLEAVVSTFSAGAIAIFTVILAGVYEYLNSRVRKDQSLLIGMSLLSLGALFLALEGGFGQLHDPHHITWILGLLTLEAYYLAYRFEERHALPAGIAIGLLAWLQLVHFVFAVRPDVSVLSYASLVLIVTGVLRKRLSSGLSQLFAITDWSLVGITLIGAFTVIGKMDSGWKTFGVSVWLGLIWLALGLLLNLYPGFVLFQAAFIFGIFSKNPDKADFALWLAVFAAVWSVLRTVVRRRLTIVDESGKPAGSLLRMLMWENLTLDQVASALLLGTLLLSHSWGLLTAVDQIKTVGGTPTFSFALGASATKSWLTIAVLAVAFITGLWDRFNKLAALCSYALLVSAGFTLLTVLKLEPPKAVLAGGGVICAVAALGLIALSERFRLEEKLAALEIRRPSESWWTASAFALLLVTLLGTALAGVLNFSSLAYRLGAAGEVAVAGILLVRTVSKFGVAGRYAATLYCFAGLVLAGFSAVSPGGRSSFFSREVVVFTAALVVAEFLAFKLYRTPGDWRNCARHLSPIFGVAASLVLAAILLMEFTDRAFWTLNSYPTFPVLFLFFVLLGLCVQAFICAIRDGVDPFEFGETGLRGYVFASEGLLVLAIVHLRLTMPWLFGTWFQRYWPFGVMIIAFLGVGAGEIFRRLGKNRLAIPLHQTGFFLPLLPALAFWIASSEVNYSALLVLAGALYALVAIMRQSVIASFLACLAANGALWHYLGKDQDISIFSRPQLWLMPLGASILIAAWFNRSRLQASQMVLMRYAALLLIYVSSTAELIIKGTQAAPWEPLVLMAISVAGILSGVMLRIRSFLYLGTSFLLVSILAVIWNAATNFGWTWLWYVTGIALGIGIILLFAVFEKKRDQLPGIAMKLREWNG